jgi:cytochrome P450
VSDSTTTLVYDPWDHDLALDPWPVFARLRDEAPLYYNEEHDFWALSRADDIEAAHVDRETFISRRGGTLELLKLDMEMPVGTVIFEDPPTHAIHRALIARMFTPKRVKEIEPRIRRIVVDLLDRIEGQSEFDFVTDFSWQLPMAVISSLVGIPEESQEMVRDHFLALKKDPDRRNNEHVLAGELFAPFVDARMEEPTDDVISQLLTAEFEDEHGQLTKLTREELLAYINIVAAAGNDTTGILIAWMGKILSEHPEQRQRLVDDPSLIPNAADELARFEPPPLQSCRYVTRDVEFHGQTIPAGSKIALLIASGNRDESRFDDPDTFDVGRELKQIYTFGFGAHFCLGRNLARLEVQILLEELLPRIPEWTVDLDRAQFAHNDPDLRPWNSMPAVVG